MSHSIESIPDWDPLDVTADEGMMAAAQRREIRNILKSYTGYFDLFAELLQNALDAVERRAEEEAQAGANYSPTVWVELDIENKRVSVTDNGCGMDLAEFKQFLAPSWSFKDATRTRGSKGVGATYLAYGFHHVQFSTRRSGRTYSGVLKDGRKWVDDESGTVYRPTITTDFSQTTLFSEIDQGTSITVSLDGDNVRPSDLTWIGARTAEQWMPTLRVNTALGGVYLGPTAPRDVKIKLCVKDSEYGTTSVDLEQPRYLYPHDCISNTVDVRDYIHYIIDRADKGQTTQKAPPKYQKKNGIWGIWSIDEILGNHRLCPITTRLDDDEAELAKRLDLQIYIFLAFSTDVWDSYNDERLGLRKNYRLLHGGIQLATRHMPQGGTVTIPLTNNIGFQQMAHVVVHMNDAEPDLGRKGFQPEVVRVAEKLSVSAVTGMRRYLELLRKAGGQKEFGKEYELDQWIKAQETHEHEHPLVISGRGLFMPQEELPIRSEPVVEQDVVALFNQMISAGLVRGIELIASSQFKQYDGLFRVHMETPFDKFILAEENPLGVDPDQFVGQDRVVSKVKILEYKYSVNGLIEEIEAEIKSTDDISLVVAWEMGEKWKELFDVMSYLDPDHESHRWIHGSTHSFSHSITGQPAFEGIILKDLVGFLTDRENEVIRQRNTYGNL